MNTENWINFIIKETENSLMLLYSYMGFQKAQSYSEIVDELNKNPHFWQVYIAAIQQTLFLCLGRLSDDGRECKSFSGFNNHCILNVSDFSKESFILRYNDKLTINPNYIDNSIFPSKEDICNLFSISKGCNDYLRKECKIIRSKVFAHAICTEKDEYSCLFEKVTLDKIENVLLAFWTIAKHLWECYHNAKTINSQELLQFSEKDQIYKRTYDAIRGII